MKQYITSKLVLILLLGSTLSCNNLLEEIPSKQQDIIPTTVEHLEGFLPQSISTATSYADNLIISDDLGYAKEIQQKLFGFNQQFMYYPLTWDMNSYKDALVGFPTWGILYAKIYFSNTILEYLGEVEGTPEQLQRLEGDAYFARAYSNFELARNFCTPYSVLSGNENASGIPIKTNSSLIDIPERGTISGTYDFIIEDLKKAENLLKDQEMETSEVNTTMQWRASTAAVYALSARVYLRLGDFEEALRYSDLAISTANKARLANYRSSSDISYSAISESKVTVYYEPNTPVVEVLRAPITSESTYGKYTWPETIYQMPVVKLTFFLAPSQTLSNAYGENSAERNLDLRWKYNFCEGQYFKNMAFTGTLAGGGAQKICGYVGRFENGLSVPEVHLIKAECLVRLDRIAEAETLINLFRAQRIDASAPADYINLKFTSKDDAIRQILDERRREFPFFFRWTDLSRIAGYGEFQNIPSSMSRDFFETTPLTIDLTKPVTYTFKPEQETEKFALPIPINDIQEAERAGVTLEQNTYPN